MLHIDKIYEILLEYIDAYIAPKFSGPQKYAVYTLVFAGAKKREHILPLFRNKVLPILGITDNNFNINISFIEDWANYMLSKSDGEIEFSKEIPFLGKIGYIADKEDVTHFINKLKEHDNESNA